MPEIELCAYGAASTDAAEANTSLHVRLTIALAWTAARKARDDAFNLSFFHNPAWDILLALYVSHARGEPVCVKNLFHSSNVAHTTLIRWMSTLEEEELIRRFQDPDDRRRTLAALTELGIQKMETALDASAASDAKLGLGRLRLV